MNTAAIGLIPGFPATTTARAPLVRSAEELRSALRTPATRHLPLDLAQLDRVLRLDARARLVEVQPGASWQALCSFLSAQAPADAQEIDRALLETHLPGTIGECVGRNCAGPDARPFVDYVEALTIVTADGELRRTNRSLQPELFRTAIGGHGVIGVVYSATLRVDALLRACAEAFEPVVLEEATSPASGKLLTSRFMLPPARLEGFLVDLRRLLEDYRLPVSRLSVRRALPDADTFLQWATGELAVIEISFPDKGTLPARTAATQVRRGLIAAALAHGGRFDLASSLEASREQVEAAYPMFSAFLAEKRRYDPQDRLGGAWFRHYASLFRRERCESRWTNAQ
jgi:FAD/FMN-containing dehydrogenase